MGRIIVLTGGNKDIRKKFARLFLGVATVKEGIDFYALAVDGAVADQANMSLQITYPGKLTNTNTNFIKQYRNTFRMLHPQYWAQVISNIMSAMLRTGKTHFIVLDLETEDEVKHLVDLSGADVIHFLSPSETDSVLIYNTILPDISIEYERDDDIIENFDSIYENYWNICTMTAQDKLIKKGKNTGKEEDKGIPYFG